VMSNAKLQLYMYHLLELAANNHWSMAQVAGW
jgi:hypothetical protein